MQLLRGVQSDPPVASREAREDRPARPTSARKRRRIAGEDDTERDIRLARDSSALVPSDASLTLAASRKPFSHAPLTDGQGHISLFPEEGSRAHASKNPEAEAEAARKKRELEDRYTMRFSNAAGFKQGMQAPWYSSTRVTRDDASEAVGQDVWGNEDRGRKDRQERRMTDNDPLVSMRRGVQELRRVEQERKAWAQEREREMRQLRRTERRSRRSRPASDEPDLDDFSLDDQGDGHRPPRKSRHRDRSRRRERRHRTSRSRSRSGSRGGDHVKERSHHVADGSRQSHRHRRSSPSTTHASHTPRHERDRRKRHMSPHAQDSESRPGWEKGVGGRYSNQFRRT